MSPEEVATQAIMRLVSAMNKVLTEKQVIKVMNQYITDCLDRSQEKKRETKDKE